MKKFSFQTIIAITLTLVIAGSVFYFIRPRSPDTSVIVGEKIPRLQYFTHDLLGVSIPIPEEDAIVGDPYKEVIIAAPGIAAEFPGLPQADTMLRLRFYVMGETETRDVFKARFSEFTNALWVEEQRSNAFFSETTTITSEKPWKKTTFAFEGNRVSRIDWSGRSDSEFEQLLRTYLTFDKRTKYLELSHLGSGADQFSVKSPSRLRVTGRPEHPSGITFADAFSETTVSMTLSPSGYATEGEAMSALFDPVPPKEKLLTRVTDRRSSIIWPMLVDDDRRIRGMTFVAGERPVLLDAIISPAVAIDPSLFLDLLQTVIVSVEIDIASWTTQTNAVGQYTYHIPLNWTVTQEGEKTILTEPESPLLTRPRATITIVSMPNPPKKKLMEFINDASLNTVQGTDFWRGIDVELGINIDGGEAIRLRDYVRKPASWDTFIDGGNRVIWISLSPYSEDPNDSARLIYRAIVSGFTFLTL